MAFHESLFANQPQGGSSGLSDDDLALLAKRAGVPVDVAETLSAGEFTAIVRSGTEKDLNVVQGTPAVFLNGTQFQGNLYVRGELKAAIDAI